MCSLTGNDYDDSVECMERKKSEKLIGAMCKKCHEKIAEVVLRAKDTYCRDCFLESFAHKFRATLGKSKMIKPNDSVLIGLSGSLSSFAMLQLIKEGREIISPKRLQCIPFVLYIDEGAVLGHSEEFRNEVYKDISRLLVGYNIPGYVTSLDCNINWPVCHAIDKTSDLITNREGDIKMKELFLQLKTFSSKEDLLQKLRHQVLLKVAENLGCSKVFVGDCTTNLAISIMSNVSLGRGAHIALDTGFCDSRNSKVHILRPMRGLTKKEIAYYCVFKNIETLYFPKLTTKADQFSCIQKLTEKFIIELQDEFPATVSTIFCTGDKLSLEGIGEEGVKCILCQAPLDTSKRESSSMQATEFSRLISASQHLIPDKTTQSVDDLAGYDSDNRPNQDDTSSFSCCSPDKHCACEEKEKSQKLGYQQMRNYLCYGCRLIVKEMDSLELLPANVIEKAKIEVTQAQLRSEIQDFLL